MNIKLIAIYFTFSIILGFSINENSVIAEENGEPTENETATKSEEELKKIKALTVEDMLERIRKLESLGMTKKMISPAKEIEFLYEVVLNNGDKDTMVCIENTHKEITGLKLDFFGTLDFDESKYTQEKNRENGVSEEEKQQILSDFQSCRLVLMENRLGLNENSNKKLIERIGKIHLEINNPDWDSDRIRFGILTSYLKDSDGVGTSLSASFYPTYLRHVPGKWDFRRRLSFMVAFGSGESLNDKISISGPIYSSGIAYDVLKGASIALLASFYSHNNENNEDKVVKAFSVGVSLNSELWKTMFQK